MTSGGQGHGGIDVPGVGRGGGGAETFIYQGWAGGGGIYVPGVGRGGGKP